MSGPELFDSQVKDDIGIPMPNVYIPPGTTVYAPDGIHRVTVQLPDENSAILFYEFLRQLVIIAERKRAQTQELDQL